MNDEQRKALARLFRQLAKSFAEIPALTSLLDSYEANNEPPKNWRSMLDELRTSEEYVRVIAEFEPVLQLLETSSDDRELIRMLQKISSGKLPN